jgi:hypothetical protein
LALKDRDWSKHKNKAGQDSLTKECKVVDGAIYTQSQSFVEDGVFTF